MATKRDIDYSVCLVAEVAGMGEERMYQLVKEGVQSGITVLIYSPDARLSASVQTATGRALLELTRAHGVPLLVRGSVDLALILAPAGCAGVVLSHGDWSVSEARRVLGGHMVIGVAASSVDDVVRLVREEGDVDYFNVGPIFGTKEGFPPEVGVPGLMSILTALSAETKDRSSPVRITCAGGVTTSTLPAALSYLLVHRRLGSRDGSGGTSALDGITVATSLITSQDPGNDIRQLRGLVDQFKQQYKHDQDREQDERDSEERKKRELAEFKKRELATLKKRVVCVLRSVEREKLMVVRLLGWPQESDNAAATALGVTFATDAADPPARDERAVFFSARCLPRDASIAMTTTPMSSYDGAYYDNGGGGVSSPIEGVLAYGQGGRVPVVVDISGMTMTSRRRTAVLSLFANTSTPPVDILISTISDAETLDHLLTSKPAPAVGVDEDTTISAPSSSQESSSTVPNTPPPEENDDDHHEISEHYNDHDRDGDGGGIGIGIGIQQQHHQLYIRPDMSWSPTTTTTTTYHHPPPPTTTPTTTPPPPPTPKDQENKAATLALRLLSTNMSSVAVIVTYPTPSDDTVPAVAVYVATKARIARVRVCLANTRAVDMVSALPGRVEGLISVVVAALAAGLCSSSHHHMNTRANFTTRDHDTAKKAQTLAEAAIVGTLMAAEAVRLATNDKNTLVGHVGGPASLGRALVDLVWCMRAEARRNGDGGGVEWVRADTVQEVDVVAPGE